MSRVAFADDAAAGFDDNYDVVVVGYGFAGGMAAISVADAGAEKVLLVDAASEGQEGGNSRFLREDQIGAISPVRDPDSNYRVYTNDDVFNVVQHNMLKNAGFEVADAQVVMEGSGEDS